MMCDDISNTAEWEAKGRKKIQKKQRNEVIVRKSDKERKGEGSLFHLNDYKTSLIIYSLLFVQRKYIKNLLCRLTRCGK